MFNTERYVYKGPTSLKGTIEHTFNKTIKQNMYLRFMKILNILFLTLALNSFGQSSENFLVMPPPKADTVKQIEVVNFPDIEAEFPGGNTSLMQYIANNIVYPPAALSEQFQGKVYVQFIVSDEGFISDIKILRGLRKDCDDEAIRVLSIMPLWKPARHNGYFVHSKMTIPIKFTLIN